VLWSNWFVSAEYRNYIWALCKGTQLVVGTVEKVEVFHTRPLSNLSGQGTFGSDTDKLVWRLYLQYYISNGIEYCMRLQWITKWMTYWWCWCWITKVTAHAERRLMLRQSNSWNFPPISLCLLLPPITHFQWNRSLDKELPEEVLCFVFVGSRHCDSVLMGKSCSRFIISWSTW
jgi:hypothetical protein